MWILCFGLLSLSYSKAEKRIKEKAITNKEWPLLKTKLKRQCIIIKRKHCFTTPRNRSQACMRNQAHAWFSSLQAGSWVSQLLAQAREWPQRPIPGYIYTGELFKMKAQLWACCLPPLTVFRGRMSTSGSHWQHLNFAQEWGWKHGLMATDVTSCCCWKGPCPSLATHSLAFTQVFFHQSTGFCWIKATP